jgi:hypothetical protein
MELHEQDGRSGDNPQQPVTVIGPEHGIRGDASWVVIRESGQQPWPEHGHEGDEGTNAAGAETRELQRNATPVMGDRVRRRTRALAGTVGQGSTLTVTGSHRALSANLRTGPSLPAAG